MPRTFTALEDGAIALAKVKVLVEESLNLTVAQCAVLEAAVRGQAGPLPAPRQFSREQIDQWIGEDDAAMQRLREGESDTK